MASGRRSSPGRLGTQTRASLRSDSDMSVSLAWKGPAAGRHVGWNCTKPGLANAAPRRYARQIAVAFDAFALVDRK
jgi:hypothetical protein